MEELEIAVAVLYTVDRTPEGKSFYRLLLEDRRSHPKYGEEWGFFGGVKEPEDKSIEGTLKREVKEELGIELPRYIYFKAHEWNPVPDVYVKEHYFLGEVSPQLGGMLSDDEQNILSKDRSRIIGRAYTIEEAKALKMMASQHIMLENIEAYFNR